MEKSVHPRDKLHFKFNLYDDNDPNADDDGLVDVIVIKLVDDNRPYVDLYDEARERAEEEAEEQVGHRRYELQDG